MQMSNNDASYFSPSTPDPSCLNIETVSGAAGQKKKRKKNKEKEKKKKKKKEKKVLGGAR